MNLKAWWRRKVLPKLPKLEGLDGWMELPASKARFTLTIDSYDNLPSWRLAQALREVARIVGGEGVHLKCVPDFNKRLIHQYVDAEGGENVLTISIWLGTERMQL